MKKINIDVCHEQLFLEKPLLAFDPNANYEEWKEKVWNKFYELLGFEKLEENRCELKPEIEEIYETEEYIRYRFTFDSELFATVPCYLLIPKQNKEKYPLLICLQGHTTGFHNSIGEFIHDFDEKQFSNQTFALDAVKNGFAALAIEQRGMGERTTPRKDRGWALQCGCYHTVFTALLLGRTINAERAWDVSRAIDVLPQLDACKHIDLEDITLLGHSGGGTATYYTAAYEKRIKYVVPCGCLCTYKDSIGEYWHCSCNYIPHIAEYFDMGEIAALIAPRKMFTQQGAEDHIFPKHGAEIVHNTIRQIYEKAGAKDNFSNYFTPGEKHYFDTKVVFENILKMRK